MDFGSYPPEVNSARMYAGAGSGPMLSAAEAWDGLAAELHATANSYQSVVSGLTAGTVAGSGVDIDERRRSLLHGVASCDGRAG